MDKEEAIPSQGAKRAEVHIEKTQIYIRKLITAAVIVFLIIAAFFGAWMLIRIESAENQTRTLLGIATDNQKIAKDIQSLADQMKVLLDKARPCVPGETPPAPACAVEAERDQRLEGALRQVAEEQVRQHNRLLEAFGSRSRVPPSPTPTPTTASRSSPSSSTPTTRAPSAITTINPRPPSTTTTTCPRLPNGKCEPEKKGK